MDSIPRYAIFHTVHGVGSDCVLTILCYGTRFRIFLWAKNFAGKSRLANEYLRLINKLNFESFYCLEIEERERCGESGGVQQGDPMDELCLWIVCACNSHMHSLAPFSNAQSHPLRTLQDYYDLPTLVLVPAIVNGELHVD
ncbi:hypothetical protein BJX70DRAFT_185756 [Aspergillus crustosus]